MVTLGFWDEFVGRPFVRASTTFHEIGHNLNLWHGGFPATWGNKALNTSTFVEPTCKPDLLTSMSYAFQVHGLFDDTDNIHLDYSGTPQNNIDAGRCPAHSTPKLPASLVRTGRQCAGYEPRSFSSNQVLQWFEI